MTTPDWPERKYRILYVSSSTQEDEGNKFFHERYVLELERRYKIAMEALVGIEEYWNGSLNETATRDAAIVTAERAREALAQCPPLPEEPK
jgi:hypothetical protein